MRYNRHIHPLQMVLKSFLGAFEFLIHKFDYSNKELIVVNYHSTPEKFLPNFEAQVIFFKKYYNIIDPVQLENYYSGQEWNANRCSLLFTFDDGLKNNLKAAELLQKHGIRAYFFIVPAFVETEKEHQKSFYIKNIRPIINPAIDHQDEDFQAMSWQEIKTLLAQKHHIGSHTYTHTLIAKESDKLNSEKEIIGSKSFIQQKLGITVHAFCSINNTLWSVEGKEKKMISDNYSFHFTTLPGLNTEDKDTLFIKRRNIESHWLMGAVCYALGKTDLKRWKSRITSYKNR